MLQLIVPSAAMHEAFTAAHGEWGPGLHEDGFGLSNSDEVESPEGFSEWLARLEHDSAGAAGDEPSFRCLYRWIVDGGDVLGGIALRYGSDESVTRLGHFGYGVRPSARRRGVATWALGEMVHQARIVGLEQVTVVCLDDNAASARTIERNGGVLDAVVDSEHGAVRRYRIGLDQIT